MELILALLLGGGCVAVGSWAVRRHRRRAGARSAERDDASPRSRQSPGREAERGEPERGLDDLRPDDVVTHDGDWLVTGVAHLSESGVTWLECRLEDASRESWIVVHPADPDGVLIGQRVTDLAVAGGRPSDSLDHQGAVFRLRRFGRAVVQVQGQLDGRHLAGECGYWNYDAAGDARVWFRQMGDEWSYYGGQRVARHLVGYLPGS